MNNRVLKFVTAIESNAIISSVKKGLILLMPILITGAVALMLRSFPIDAFQVWLASPAGYYIDKILLFLYDSTFGFLSAFLVLSISYYYSGTFKLKNFSFQILSMIVSLACFVASFGGVSGSLEISHFGPTGVFTALICAILATKMFYALSKYIFDRLNYHIVAAEVDYRNSLASILPLTLCVMVFIAINLIIDGFFSVSNFNDLISFGLVNLFENIDNELLAGLLFTFMLNFLWFFGIHAGNALDEVTQAIFSDANVVQGISKTFLDNFALIGGCGAATCLLLALLIASKGKDNKRLAWISLPTIAFNINEILIFGLPVVLNPIMFIPFLTVPIVSLLIGFSAQAIGIIPPVLESVKWTTPVFFSGYLATGSVWGIVVQIIIIAVGTVIYIPFVRLSEKMSQERKKIMVNKMTDVCKSAQESGRPYLFLDKNDEMSMTAKAMINSLRQDMENGMLPMYFQPQLDYSGNIVGAEALLRWRYNGEMIFPPLALSLSQEDGIFSKLVECIIEQVCSQIPNIRAKTFDEIKISINIASQQLDDINFVRRIIEIVEKYGVVRNVLLEVTEESSLMSFENITSNIAILKESGLFIAIDDFSMGQTSLKYLQTNSFDCVKLDGELVKKITDNTRSTDIIESITSLGDKLGFYVVAEYVETQELMDKLKDLGCKYFQGYLFSPAISEDDFIKYCENKKE